MKTLVLAVCPGENKNEAQTRFEYLQKKGVENLSITRYDTVFWYDYRSSTPETTPLKDVWVIAGTAAK
jgi:hypothetical protein